MMTRFPETDRSPDTSLERGPLAFSQRSAAVKGTSTGAEKFSSSCSTGRRPRTSELDVTGGGGAEPHEGAPSTVWISRI